MFTSITISPMSSWKNLYATLMIHGENRSNLFRKMWLDAADQRFHHCTHVADSAKLECRYYIHETAEAAQSGVFQLCIDI